MTLLINNDLVKRVLTMEDCIQVQEEAFKGLVTGDAVHRPRIDVYVPCDRDDGYYRWGSMEGASKRLGIFAIRVKSDELERLVPVLCRRLLARPHIRKEADAEFHGSSRLWRIV